MQKTEDDKKAKYDTLSHLFTSFGREKCHKSRV